MLGVLNPASRAMQLVDCIADLHLGYISPREWLHRMAEITDSASVTGLGFTPGDPASQQQYASDGTSMLSMDAITAIDTLLKNPEWHRTGIIGPDTAPEALQRQAAELADPRLMLGLIDWEPGCVILMLRSRDAAGWTATDRANFAAAIPTLRKAHLAEIATRSLKNYLEIANAAINSSTHGVVCMLQNMQIVKANRMAFDMLDAGDDFALKDGKVIVCNLEIAAEIENQVAQIYAAPLTALGEFAWNRGYPSRRGGLCQISLRASPLSDFRVETTAEDRFIIMSLNATAMSIQPSIDQLGQFYQLTSAQAKVVSCLLHGHSPAEAAENLHISVNTVRSHLRTIYSKLAVDNQTDLVRTVSQTLVDYAHSAIRRE